MQQASFTALQENIRGRSILVEIVGPSASGKTTLARTLAARISHARIAASARPAEMAAGGRLRLPPAVARAGKIIQACPGLGGAPSASQDAAEQLMVLLPPPGPLWRLRWRRYLAYLSARWTRERTEGGIPVFDQGFVTAIGTLATLSRRSDAATLARALEAVPRPDLIIRIETPRAIIASRLRARLGAQGIAERLFELGIPETLRQIEVFEALDPLLDAGLVPVVRVSCPDREALERAAADVEAGLERIGIGRRTSS